MGCERAGRKELVDETLGDTEANSTADDVSACHAVWPSGRALQLGWYPPVGARDQDKKLLVRRDGIPGRLGRCQLGPHLAGRDGSLELCLGKGERN